MRAKLIPIGKARGIRIPEIPIEQCGFGNVVDLRVENKCLVVASGRSSPRRGWAAAFKAAGSSRSDELVLGQVLQNDFDRHEWTW